MNVKSHSGSESKGIFTRAVPLWLVFVLILLWLATSFFLYFRYSGNRLSSSDNKEDKKEAKVNGQFPLLNSNLETGNNSFVHPFRDDVEQFIKKAEGEGKATAIAVYFRGLNDGYTFGINDRENFHPASLMKVPEFIAYLKMAQDTPGLLDRKVLFQPTPANSPNTIPKKLQPGAMYSIRELLQQMIIYSDNDATLILDNMLPEKVRNKVYDDFGLKTSLSFSPDADYLCLSDYMRFFRTLYNASYLNKDMSQFALETLCEVYFKDGLVAGSGGNKIAHKYGQWFSKGESQMHDCGIVFFGGQPYLLGVMTKGKNVYTLAEVIQGIADIVYQNMQKAS